MEMPTRTARPILAQPDTLDALRAWVTLARATAACSERVEAQLADAGLTTSQFGVLEALYHKGPAHPCDLAAKILRTTGNLTLVLDQLEKQGLVRRERCADDRRYMTIHLTDAGTARIEVLFPEHARRVAELFSVFTPAECRAFGDACRTLGVHAAQSSVR